MLRTPTKDGPKVIAKIGYQFLPSPYKSNIAPTNGWLEYYFPIGEAYFQGLR